MQPPRDPSDDGVVSAAARGEAWAVDALIKEFQPLVQRYARLRMGPKLSRTCGVEDIAQESVLAAITSMERAGLRDHAGFGRYLLAIAERRIRNAGRRPEPMSLVDVEEHERQFEDSGQPGDELQAREHRAGLRRSIAGLPDDYRWVVVLRDYLGISWDAAAFALERPTPHSARCLYDRARNSLRSSLEVRLDAMS